MFLKDRLQITTERKYTDEGFLEVPAHISRVGIQAYTAAEMGLTDRKPDEIINVYRPAEEVFSDESLASFANKPLTDNHPPELVTSLNAKKYAVGHAGPEVVRDIDRAKTILHFTDADAITQIESGKVELSNGYTADIEWQEGVTPDGMKYDAIQTNIKGNHIAIVERGRAGSACRVADNLPPKKETKPMGKITIDDVDFEVSDQAAQAVVKLQARLKDAEEETETEAEKAKKKEDEMEEAKKEATKSEDALKAKLDDAIAKIPTDASLDTLISDRMTVVDSVRKVMPDIAWEGKDAATLKKEVVTDKCPDLNLDGKSDEYISVRFDLLTEDSNSNSQANLDDAFSKSVETKDSKTDNRPASVIARENMMQDSQSAWKGGKE